ncbi:hypothetical protein QQS21_012320 [Conoideocrella luteorostrata]|uniref:Peptidase M43 pregnancy-associated plasma-A domain-containing protein n=1 Tax=Conoideocrella luteorostrata TaxID=1105319 RepID=A0AAJ0CE50_9HYPO|nr:hypothetical protein QQS21_012320 [Conoideocrella luteorostrata]
MRAAILSLAVVGAAAVQGGSNDEDDCLAQPPEKMAEILESLATTDDKRWLFRRDENSTIHVDLYMHVVASSTTSTGYLTNDTVDKQFAVLNSGYKPARIVFNRKGDDWTVNPAWSTGQNELTMKRALRKGDKKSINIYFLEAPHGRTSVHGSSTFPDDLSKPNGLVDDGCLIQANTTFNASSTNTYMERFGGVTAIHEVGHWFGLYHTFSPEAGLKGPDPCSYDADKVNDTPIHRINTACQAKNSCKNQPGMDPIENYMNYGGDECRSQFTPGQIERMHQQWQDFRLPSTDRPLQKLKWEPGHGCPEDYRTKWSCGTAAYCKFYDERNPPNDVFLNSKDCLAAHEEPKADVPVTTTVPSTSGHKLNGNKARPTSKMNTGASRTKKKEKVATPSPTKNVSKLVN